MWIILISGLHGPARAKSGLKWVYNIRECNSSAGIGMPSPSPITIPEITLIEVENVGEIGGLKCTYQNDVK